MKVEDALALLGLSNEPHKPIEVDRAFFRLGKGLLTQEAEARDLLMRKPEIMAPLNSYDGRKRLIDEYGDYRRSTRKHRESYNNWKYRQNSSLFEKLYKFFEVFGGVSLIGVLFLPIPLTLVVLTLTGSVFYTFENIENLYLTIGAAALIGLAAAILEPFSWPLNVWWDRKIKGLPWSRRWLLDPRVMLSCLFAAIIGIVVCFFGVGLISGVNNIESLRLPSIVLAVLCVFINLELRKPLGSESIFRKRQKDDGSIRSEWEDQIARHIIDTFPSLEVELNNRSIIKSQDVPSEYYEIDVWIPELMLGIEANGEQFHDHKAYKRDKREGTTNSREMYKEKYCQERGIELIHVWSSEEMRNILGRIDREIEKRMAIDW